MFKLIIISMSIFLTNSTIDSGVYASDRNFFETQDIDSRTQCCFFDFFHKLLGGCSDIQELPSASVKTQTSHKKLPEKSSNEKRISSLSNSPLNQLSSDMIQHVAQFLSPVDLLNAMKTCTYLNEVYSKKCFWVKYNGHNNYVLWDQSIPPMNCAFANYYYNVSKVFFFKRRSYVYKAADLGHPDALMQKRKWEHIALKAQIEHNRMYVGWDMYSSFEHNKPSYLGNIHI